MSKKTYLDKALVPLPKENRKFYKKKISITAESLKHSIEKFILLPVPELFDIINNKDKIAQLSGLEMTIVVNIIQAMTKGDIPSIQFLMNKMIGSESPVKTSDQNEIHFALQRAIHQKNVELNKDHRERRQENKRKLKQLDEIEERYRSNYKKSE